jgi:hypothetical protein
MLLMTEKWKVHFIKIILGKLIPGSFVRAKMFIHVFTGVDTGTKLLFSSTHIIYLKPTPTPTVQVPIFLQISRLRFGTNFWFSLFLPIVPLFSFFLIWSFGEEYRLKSSSLRIFLHPVTSAWRPDSGRFSRNVRNLCHRRSFPLHTL